MHQVLEIMEAESRVGTLSSYSVLSTSIEDIFLGLMHANDDGKLEKSVRSSSETPSAVHGEHDNWQLVPPVPAALPYAAPFQSWSETCIPALGQPIARDVVVVYSATAPDGVVRR